MNLTIVDHYYEIIITKQTNIATKIDEEEDVRE